MEGTLLPSLAPEVSEALLAEAKWPDANCVGQHEIFFPSPQTIGGEWERETEVEAKALCRSCPKQIKCLELGLEPLDTDARHVVVPGVYGGTNQWERAWLSRFPSRAMELAAELEMQGVDPQELRLYAEANPPPTEGMDSPAKISEDWGVPPSVARSWLSMTGAKKTSPRRPWSDAVREVLETQDGWHDRRDLLDIASQLLPPAQVEKKRQTIARRRGTCSVRSAQDAILDGVIRLNINQGLWESRRCPDTGRVQFKRAAKIDVRRPPALF